MNLINFVKRVRKFDNEIKTLYITHPNYNDIKILYDIENHGRCGKSFKKW